MSIILTLPSRAPSILDAVLAEQFGTETRRINEVRSRNPERFPDDFAFQLTKKEVDLLRSQNAIFSQINGLGDKLTNLLDSWLRYAPWAYTEEGVAQVAGILSTPQAVAASVRTLRLFRETREELYVSRAALASMSKALLAQNPLWRNILRFKRMELNHAQIAKLCDLDRSTIRKHVRDMEACGLLAAPPSLPLRQQLLLNLEGGAA